MLTSPTTDFSFHHHCCPTREVPVLHPFAYQGCFCNFQHAPGRRNASWCAGKSQDCSLSRICPVSTCAVPSTCPWVQFNSWHGPGIVPQSGLCAAPLFWGLLLFTSVGVGWCVPLDFKVQDHLFVIVGSQHVPPRPSPCACQLPLWLLPFQISATAIDPYSLSVQTIFKRLLHVKIASVLRCELIPSLSSRHEALCSYRDLFHKAQPNCRATALPSLSLSMT